LLAVFADNSKQPQPAAAVLEHRLAPLRCISYFPPIPPQKCSQLSDYNTKKFKPLAPKVIYVYKPMQCDAQNGEHHINMMPLPFTFWSLQITTGT